MKKLIILLILFAFIIEENQILAQEGMFDNGRITGNFQIDMQSYTKDTLIGAYEDIDEKVLSNGFLWLNYTSNNFNAGLRYENYLNPILGIDKRFKGNGIAFRFAELNSEVIDITAGNFYEQFGSGLILRSYQEYALGYDNAFDGLRVKFRPTDAIEIKGLVGKQRKYWSQSEGIVRGGDISININNLFHKAPIENLNIDLGSSVVSKFQKDVNSTYNLPQNVLLWASRVSLNGSFYSIYCEYAYKNPDPASANKWNFNPGNALVLNTSFFSEGIGISLNFHRYDNMDIRVDRDELGNSALLNYLPPLTKMQAYSLATMYPYATQLNGEIGYQAELTYNFQEETLLGGKYGTTINVNYSHVNSIPKNPIEMDTIRNQVLTYDSPFFEFGKDLYFSELNFELTKKFSKSIRTIFTFINQIYNRDVIEAESSAHYGKVYNNILVADVLYKFNPEIALRTELQHMWSTQDSTNDGTDRQFGNWISLLMELTFSPHWYFSLQDQYNYGNNIEDFKTHYLTGMITYIYDATRISFSYGRQRSGIICIGGVCRPVPAANGFSLSVSSSF